MAERKYRQIDSPWIDMSHLDWGPLTDERYARHFFRGHIFYGQQEYSENVFIIKRYAQHHGAGRRMHVRQPDPV